MNKHTPVGYRYLTKPCDFAAYYRSLLCHMGFSEQSYFRSSNPEERNARLSFDSVVERVDAARSNGAVSSWYCLDGDWGNYSRMWRFELGPTSRSPIASLKLEPFLDVQGRPRSGESPWLNVLGSLLDARLIEVYEHQLESGFWGTAKIEAIGTLHGVFLHLCEVFEVPDSLGIGDLPSGLARCALTRVDALRFISKHTPQRTQSSLR